MLLRVKEYSKYSKYNKYRRVLKNKKKARLTAAKTKSACFNNDEER